MKTSRKDRISMYVSGAVLALGALVFFLALVSRYFYARLGHDQSSYLEEAGRFLSGATIYGPRLSETNPPLIIWFSTLPVLLGHGAHGASVFFFRVLLIAMILCSTAWCVTLLRRGTGFVNAVSLGLVGCIILIVEFGTGTYDFGQRENLLIILLLPYVLAVASGAVKRLSVMERCALGVAASLAIWFKPQDLLVLIALELFLCLRTRSLRRVFSAEFLALVLGSLLLLVSVWLMTPLYFTSTIPLLRDAYWALGSKNTVAMALSLPLYTAMVLVLLLLCLLLRRRLHDSATSVALLLCSVGASFAYDVQHTDWGYHAYPHRVLLMLAAGYMIVDLLSSAIERLTSDTDFVRRMMLIAAGCMAVLLCAAAIRPRLVLPNPNRLQEFGLDRFFSQIPPATTVFVFSTDVSPLSSAYNHGLNWGSRFAHLWMLPAIVQNEEGPKGPPAPFKQLSSERVAQLADLQRTETIEDMNYWHPAVVLVWHCTPEHVCPGLEGRKFDILSWFLRDPRFAAVWSHYQRQPDFEDFDVYKLVP